MIDQSVVRNRLLSRASPKVFALLADGLEPFKCIDGSILNEANTPLRFVYFLESGIASVVAHSPEGQKAEAGVIGREGFLHPATILGCDTTPFQLQIQMPGEAHRIAVDDFRRITAQVPAFMRTLLLFTHVNAVQASFSTLSNAVHQIDERLARWLLICHDRSESDDLLLTHEFMSTMLSVRRPSVTNALHTLEGNGFIKSDRGCVTIRNRQALEEFAADAYGAPEAEYRRLLGPI